MKAEEFNHLRPRRFYLKAVKDKRATEAAGRPVFKDVEMFEAKIVGDPSRTIVAPAGEKFIQAPREMMFNNWEDVDEDDLGNKPWLSYADVFKDEYAAWKASGVMSETGTPIEMLAFLSPRRIAELKVKNVTTVEGLSTLPDRLLKDCGMTTRDEREMAKAWLDNSEKAAAVAQLAEKEALFNAKIKALEEKLDFALKSKPAEKADDGFGTDEEIRAELAEYGIKLTGKRKRADLIAALESVREPVLAVDGPAMDAFVVED